MNIGNHVRHSRRLGANAGPSFPVCQSALASFYSRLPGSFFSEPTPGTLSRSWGMVYTARLSAACPVALTSYFPTCQARSFRGRTRYAKRSWGVKNQRSLIAHAHHKLMRNALDIVSRLGWIVDGDRLLSRPQVNVTTPRIRCLGVVETHDKFGHDQKSGRCGLAQDRRLPAFRISQRPITCA